MGNNSVPKFIFRLSRFPVYRGSVLGRFYCIYFYGRQMGRQKILGPLVSGVHLSNLHLYLLHAGSSDLSRSFASISTLPISNKPDNVRINVTLRRVRATIVAVEKQYIFRVRLLP